MRMLGGCRSVIAPHDERTLYPESGQTWLEPSAYDGIGTDHTIREQPTMHGGDVQVGIRRR
jgi:hypothetical protein